MSPEPVERWAWENLPPVIRCDEGDTEWLTVEIPLSLERAVTMTAHYTCAMTPAASRIGETLRASFVVLIQDRLGTVGWTDLPLAEARHGSPDKTTATFTGALRVSSPMGDRARLAVGVNWRYQGVSSKNRLKELFSREDYRELMVKDLAIEVLVRNL